MRHGRGRALSEDRALRAGPQGPGDLRVPAGGLARRHLVLGRRAPGPGVDEPAVQGALRLPRRRDSQHLRVVDGQHLPGGPRPRPRQLRQAPRRRPPPLRPDRPLPPPRREHGVGPLPRPRRPQREGRADSPARLPHRRERAQAGRGGPAAPGGGAAGGQGRGRARQPGQEHLPRQRQPRDTHAPQRRHRDDRAARRDRADGRAARASRRPARVGRRAARHHQRHPRLLEDGGRASWSSSPTRSASAIASTPW